MRTSQRARLSITACALLLGATGFAWPGDGERLVKELTSASTPRDKRDALRLLRIRHEHGEWSPEREPEVLAQLVHDRDVEVRVDALRLRATLRGGSEPWLLALNDPAPALRVAAVQALAAQAQLEPVLRASGDSDALVRLSAVHALGELADGRATSTLVAALGDPAIDVRVEAARALGQPSQHASDEALLALLTQVDDGFPEQRAAAVEALGKQLDRRAEAALARALDDPDSAVVLAALRGLALRPERALPTRVAELAEAVNDPARADLVALAAARLLRSRTSAGPPIENRTDEPWLADLEATAQRDLSLGESERLLGRLERSLPKAAALATDPLLEWLGFAPLPLRARLASLLERTGGPIAGERLLPFLADPDPARRAAYVRLFGQAGAAFEPVLLARISSDPAPEVRLAAIETLSRSVHTPTWSTLVARLQRAGGSARRDLLRVFALGFARPLHSPALLGEDARAQLLEALGRDQAGEDDVAAALGLSILGRTETPGAQARVRAALSDPRPGRQIAALRASIPDPSPAARALRRRLSEHPNPQLAATALVASALADDPLPFRWLQALIGTATWPIGPAASFALAYGTSQRQVGWAELSLCPLLQSREPVTRRNIAWTVVQRAHDTCRRRALELLEDPLEAPEGVVKLPILFASRARAVVLQDARLIVSWPDASGQIDWPRIAPVGHVDAWFGLYSARAAEPAHAPRRP